MRIDRSKRKVICKQLPMARSITCGKENPASLECEFYELEGGEVATVFTPKTIHEGHIGIMHGGMSAAILDELMGRATLHVDINDDAWVPRYVTAEMTVKYRRPIAVGETMYGYAKIDKAEEKCCFVSSEVVDETGEIMATATGVYVKVHWPADNAPEHKQETGIKGELCQLDPKEL